MEVNKDLVSTWKPFNKNMCQSCIGTCCTMPVEIKSSDLVRLNLCDEFEVNTSPKKVANVLIKKGIISNYRSKTGIFTVTQKSNQDCYFLDTKSRLCTVYENRPDVCRHFPTKMGRKLNFCPYIKK